MDEYIQPSNHSRLAILKQEVHNYPEKPGVYIFKNVKKQEIYVGKAKNLKKRVLSYFNSGKDLKTRFLIEKMAFVEAITTHSEHEALLLENNLIKRHKPQYNIDLKDGKTYPVIRITLEEFPRVFRTRRIVFDGSQYFGPFPKLNQIDTYLDLIYKLFPLRKCRGKLRPRNHPCLNYHIGRCSAPCCGYINKNDYNRLVENIRKLLSGKTDDLLKELRLQMDEASHKLQFEKAAHLRDQIEATLNITETQGIIDFNGDEKDYIGYASLDDMYSFVVMQMRNGQLIGREIFNTETYAQDHEAFRQFLTQYYAKSGKAPGSVYLQQGLETEAQHELLGTLLQPKTTIHIPRRGRHFQIVKMAKENAQQEIILRAKSRRSVKILKELQESLNLSCIPKRIEGFDVAHLSGSDSVASMVSFLNGESHKGSYRYFKLKSLKGKIDDFEALREVVSRRYSRLLREKGVKPDLILVDGGIGQVSSTVGALKKLGLSDIPVIGLAKKNEEVFLPGRSEPLILHESSSVRFLLQSIRDEAHRFATNYHKKLRKRRLTTSILQEVKGVGIKRANLILEKFGGIDKVIQSTADEITDITGIPFQIASRILDHLGQLNNRGKAREVISEDHS